MKKLIAAVLSVIITLLIVGCTPKNITEPSGEDVGTVAIGLGKSYIYSVDEGKFSTYEAGKVIAEDKIGDKIDDVTVTAGWRDNEEMTWLPQETLRGEAYSIDGISDDIAVAIKFIDEGEALTTTHYYVITNPNADLTSVEEYVIHPGFPNNAGDE